MLAALHRVLAALALAVGAAGMAGCGGTGSETDCSATACTVTFDRGVDAEASVLGVDIELVGVRGDRVRLRVAGQAVSVPVGGETQGDGYSVAVREVTKDEVAIRISAGGGG